MRAIFLVLVVAALLHPPVSRAQSVAEDPRVESVGRPGRWLAAAPLARPALPDVRHEAAPDARPLVAATSTLSRHAVWGAGAGALAGAAFGVAVVSLADCGGSRCAGERVVGVAGHALAGAAVGAAVGAIVHFLRR